MPIIQAPLERWMPRIEAILNAEGVPVPKKQLLKEALEGSAGDNRQFLGDLQRYVEEIEAVRTETPQQVSLR